MNELLLIDMMSELNPKLLQDDYMEKDMKREKSPFYKLFFLFKKPPRQSYEFPVDSPVSEEIAEAVKEIITDEDINTAELLNETGESDDMERRWSFSISIFKKKFHKLITIISGIAATVIVIISILVILLKRHKSDVKLHSKKIQIIY